MAVGAEAIIRLDNSRCERSGQRGGHHRLAHLSAALAEIGDVVGIQVLEDGGDLLLQLCLVQEFTVGVSSNGKARRDADAHGGQGTVHLTEGGVLTSNQRDVVQAEFGKPADRGYVGCRQWHAVSPSSSSILYPVPP